MAIAFRRGSADTVRTSDAGAPTADSSAAPAPTKEQQDKIAELIVKLSDYVSANIDQHRGLANVVPHLLSAIAAYDAKQVEDPFGPVQRVAAAIRAEQQADPTLTR